MTDREFAIDVVRRLRQAGHEALWAGGCVRDERLGLRPKDYDVATDARPDQVQALFRHTVAVGISFGVIDVIGPRVDGRSLIVQVATFRADGAYLDGRRPVNVRFCSAREDALRRDFTINGMFFDPLEETLHDFVGGERDLNDRLLRAIGEPRQRFTEDKLRLLRAARFAARFAMTIEPATAEAVRTMASDIVLVSAERIAEELRQLLEHPSRLAGCRWLDDLRLLAPILPEVAALQASGDWFIALRRIEALPPSASFPLALAALLLPAGRSAVAQVANRLKLSNAERDRASWLVQHGRAFAEPGLRWSVAKPLLAHPLADDLLRLHQADALAEGRRTDVIDDYARLRGHWHAQGTLDPPPLLTGDDLKALHLTPGPQFKRWLDAVRTEQLEERLSDRAAALAWVQRQRLRQADDVPADEP